MKHKEIVDSEYAEAISVRLGCSPITAEEALLGEPSHVAERAIVHIERAKRRMRDEHGWSYTFRHFNSPSLLRAYARKRGLGAFSKKEIA